MYACEFGHLVWIKWCFVVLKILEYAWGLGDEGRELRFRWGWERWAEHTLSLVALLTPLFISKLCGQRGRGAPATRQSCPGHSESSGFSLYLSMPSAGEHDGTRWAWGWNPVTWGACCDKGKWIGFWGMRTRDKVWRALAALDLLRDPGHLLALVFLSDSRTVLCGFPRVGSEVLFAKFFQLCGVFFKFKDSKDLDSQT